VTPRRRRLFWVLGILAGVAIAGGLALRAFQQNVMFYFDPSRIAAGEVRPGQRFRLGGMVEPGSLSRTPGTLEVHFVVTDFRHQVPVRYANVLPDLFREGQGVVTEGVLDPSGGFKADTYRHLLETKPTFPIERAVRGMLPKGVLGREMITKLKVYAGGEHPHQAQQPETFDVAAAL